MVTLAEEIPYAAVVSDKAIGAICSFCFDMENGKAFNVSRCLGCRVVSYCSKECQKKDWINHKGECHFLKNFSPRIPSVKCRLLARIIYKLERVDAHDAAFNGRRFEDLVDHRNDILKDPERMDEFASISLSLHEYMGEKHTPKRDVLLSIFGKVYTNYIGIGPQPHYIGLGIYVGMSAHKHSCEPDAYFLFNGNKIILRSCRLKEYSQDVTVTHTHLLRTSRIRHEDLRSRLYFICTCSVCSDPTRDFLCSSARSTCCPESYCLLDPNATQLSCFKCGKPSTIPVYEAIFANQQVSIVFEEVQNALGSSLKFNVEAAVIQKLIKAHEKFSKVLSHFNLNLLRVTDKLFDLALRVEDNSVCLKYATEINKAYKRYLSIGDPVLALRLLLTARAAAFETTPTRKVLELLEEAVATSLLTYDPRRPQFLTAELQALMSCYRMALQMNIS